MSLTIKFYVNSSDPRKADKSLTEIQGMSDNDFLLKEDTSVQNPVILVEASSFDASANYCYIANFGRYYYIQDKKIVPGGLFEIACHCDPLTTAFKSGQLGNCSGIVFRQQKKHNLYIDDGFFRVTNKPKIQTHPFSQQLSDWSFSFILAGQ